MERPLMQLDVLRVEREPSPDGRRKKRQVQLETGAKEDRVELAVVSIREGHPLSVDARDPRAHIHATLGHERQEGRYFMLTSADLRVRLRGRFTPGAAR